MASRYPLFLMILMVACSLAGAETAWAQPVDRWERWVEQGRHADVVDQLRRWIDKNPDAAEDSALLRILETADFGLLMQAPSLEHLARHRAEFSSPIHAAELLELESKLRLYAATDAETELAYRQVADDFPGTLAGAEARLRAEELGFAAAVSSKGSAALGVYLGHYPTGANAQTARRLWRSRTWDEAEEEGTVEAWMSLRAGDPEHPRADEAFAREQELALAQLGPDASDDALLRLARSYEGSPAGWETLRRAVAHSGIRLSSMAHVEVLNTTLREAAADPPVVEAHQVEAVSIRFVGSFPESARVSFGLEVKVGGDWLDWNARAALFAGTWGGSLEAPEERVGPAVHWLTAATPCRLPGVSQARVQVELEQFAQRTAWTIPIRLSRDCGGALPLAVRVAEDGVVEARTSRASVESEWTVEDLNLSPVGLDWRCDGGLDVDAEGPWFSCSGWQLRGVEAGGFVVRARDMGQPRPDSDSSHPGLGDLPVEPGKVWVAAPVPTSWHFGGRAECPLPDDPGTEEAQGDDDDSAEVEESEEPRPPAPDAPAWLVGTAEWREDLAADVDGDGLLDRLLLVVSTRTGQQWVVVRLASFPSSMAWAMPWSDPLPTAEPLLLRAGCSYELAAGRD